MKQIKRSELERRALELLGTMQDAEFAYYMRFIFSSYVGVATEDGVFNVEDDLADNWKS